MAYRIDPSLESASKVFGVRVVAPLGGRQNQHWLVERGSGRAERLVLRRWAESAESVDYEVRLLAQIAALGWPVAPVVAGPLEIAGRFWSLSPFLPGEPLSLARPVDEQRALGRLLAEFHAGIASLHDFGQRDGWRRCEEIVADPGMDQILNAHARERPEEIGILRRHLDRARTRIAGLALSERPGILVHGDFTPWNLRFQNGRLSGILDFELAHRDHRIADFALSWRGKYDAVVEGYDEVSPLAPEEWTLLTPLWWAQLIDGACRDLRNGVRDDGWTIGKLLLRSPLMGPDSVEFR